jgi:hypothetical protein
MKTVTTVSGKTLEFDHIWLHKPVRALDKDELQKADELCEEAGVEKGLCCSYNFYMARAFRETERGQKYHDIIVNKEEAERLLVNQQQPCVQAFRKYWIRDDNSWAYAYRGMDRPDDFEEWCVKLFYDFGSKETVIAFIEKKLAEIEIPQRATFFVPRKFDKAFRDIFGAGPSAPPTEEEYIDSVGCAIDDIRDYKKVLVEMKSDSNFRIVYRPEEPESEESEESEE